MNRLDEKDHEIIRILRLDARKSIRDIAKETGFRPSTVHQRMQKLVASGMIESFTLKLNPKAFGENFVVFMMISSDRILPKEAFQHTCIKEVYGITGEFDLIMKLRFNDVEAFNDFLLNYRKDFNLKKTVTMVATARVKEEP